MESNNSATLDPVELLFMELGNPCEVDRCTNIHLEISDLVYGRALETLLDRTEASTEEDHPDILFLNSVADNVLFGCHDYGLRIAFIESIGPLIIEDEQPHWGRYQREYLSHCRWIFQGRQDIKLSQDPASVGNAPGPIPAGCLDHLPKELTVSPNCTRCRKSLVKLICGRCLLRHDSHLTICTTYCSRTCQALHWSTHRSICLDRVRLIRSVELMKAIFTTIVEELSMVAPWGCSERNGMTILNEDPRTMDFLRGNFLLHKFPHEGFLVERHATMALQSQYAPYLRLRSMIPNLLRWIWGDLCPTVMEIPVLVKNVDRPLVQIGWSENNVPKSNVLRPHSVLRVYLRSGEEFAVDLAAGQFGWAESVMHWNHFQQRRVFDFTNYHRNGEMTQHPLYMPKTATAHFHRSLLADIIEQGRLTFGSSFLGRDRADPIIERGFLNAMKSLCAYKAQRLIKEPLYGRLYITSDLAYQVTITPEDRNRLKPV
ncbi:hypothetical protein F4818DRAFT_345345 [Hypoxylon cercidicola]|nr:hypothetical protein F4818DRAFT_345345 [Hypoxylon cercidicola]